jgi:hypothetical protein
MDRAIGNQMPVADGFVIAVIAGGSAILTVEQGESVVIDKIRGSCGEAEVDRIEVIENGFVALIDGKGSRELFLASTMAMGRPSGVIRA